MSQRRVDQTELVQGVARAMAKAHTQHVGDDFEPHWTYVNMARAAVRAIVEDPHLSLLAIDEMRKEGEVFRARLATIPDPEAGR